jgi:molybdenum cofactor cytidylyltransferase
MQLIEALRYKQNTAVAFVGAGGKTTALFKAARELSTVHTGEGQCKTILVTTTTHLGVWQTGLADRVIHINSPTDITKFEKDLPIGVTLLIGEETNNRLSGLSAKKLEKVHRFTEDHHLPLLIEADGSCSCPLKAPARHEPAIPEFSKHVVVVAGLTGLGKPLTREWVHRPEIYAELSGLNLGETISIEAMVNVLRNKDGGLKNIPSMARRLVILNQADTPDLQSQGRVISEQIKPDYHSTIIASLSKAKNVNTNTTDKIPNPKGEIYAVVEQIAGIILAAGASTRFGTPKQLLLWKGVPLIRHVVLAAMKAGLSPIVVVVGSSDHEVEKVISDLPVRIVSNTDWVTGLSSSIRAGVIALPCEVSGVIFLPADQPQISHVLIKRLVETHQETLAPIVAPQINGQRGNPVLFDLWTFPDLLSLKEDMGGRELFSHIPVRWVIWQDPNQLFDIDTPEDYQKFREMFPDDKEKA